MATMIGEVAGKNGRGGRGLLTASNTQTTSISKEDAHLTLSNKECSAVQMRSAAAIVVVLVVVVADVPDAAPSATMGLSALGAAVAMALHTRAISASAASVFQPGAMCGAVASE
jgi:Na+/H+-dicarboxylate symporter